MAQLAAGLPGIEIVPSSRLGVPAEAKEAFAFAVLAYEAYHGRANNLPSATGANHPTVMGKMVRGPAIELSGSPARHASMGEPAPRSR
jgi:anhydro-N-acetylmuramic acid kinase